jgi:hypothetical protein
MHGAREIMSPNIQIFESISKQDKETNKRFDTVASKEAVTIYKSEYENLKAPVWQNIKDALQNSKALFFLVGPKLVEIKNKGGNEWSLIRGWISYEVGIALALNLDVWVICDNGVTLNFPVPYVNNYSLGIETKSNGYEAKVLRGYGEGAKFEFGYSPSRRYYCPNKACGAQFNLHNVLQKDESIVCPMCLRVLTFPNGWQL